ncbi:hypothetical protein WR25_16267 [Diploscapter pachys]|uniref:COX assembly mitochondrial protein n=1 Tax=Diploscapter pachys TaxID=2018661 RepID=A0A2A2L8D1_9BILA|nr:hypothetical protein WR25_16267 [Diploscapter pachys]
MAHQPDLLKTDNLESLKEGEIFVDKETGKKYRVRKTMIGRYGGIGDDPNDRTLRKMEADVLIPNEMNKVIEREECRKDYLGLVECMRREGSAKGLYKCKPELDIFNKCKSEKFHDPAFREEITEKYLNERAAARRTGMNYKERQLEDYRKWKKEQEKLN